MKNVIEVKGLCKNYRIPIRNAGLTAAVRNLIRPQYQEVEAVRDISFSVEEGAMVGFIGSNGAGKTTTLKILSGLMVPTRGEISVLGHIPWHRKPAYLRRISMLMGNKNQLTWDNTVLDSFHILKDIYQVGEKAFESRLEELVEVLEIEELLKKLARNLSLGERAKCEFAAALLHQPAVLFLDEPTLGLDVSMQLKLRAFIRDYNAKHGTTVIITSHYMSDISSLCQRVILINQGALLYDGALNNLSESISPYKLVKFSLMDEKQMTGLAGSLAGLGEILEQEELDVKVRVRKENILPATHFLLENLKLSDLSIEDPPLEDVIDKVYREGVVAC